MHSILIKIGPFSVYSYGAMVALGFAVAALCIYQRAGIFKLDKNKMLDLTILILISGIIGARIMYVLMNFSIYKASPVEILDLSKGGLVWYGGFFLAIATIAIFIAKNKISFFTVGDLLVPYIALAQAFGRIGCFLNGCCYGLETSFDNPFGVIFPGETTSRHPVQLYSAAALLAIFLILRIWQDRRHFKGEIFLGYCILYSYKRILIEFLRGDNPRIYFGMTFSQLVSVLVLTLSMAFFIHKAIEWKKIESNSK